MKYNKGDEESKLPGKITEAMEEEEYKPHFDLSSKDFKAVKDWEVGRVYTVSMKMKEVRKMEDEDSVHACFEVEKIREG